MSHRVSTFVLCIAVAFLAGERYGRHNAPEYVNFAVIEHRLREVFCEQAMHNGLAKKCDPTFPRYHQD